MAAFGANSSGASGAGGAGGAGGATDAAAQGSLLGTWDVTMCHIEAPGPLEQLGWPQIVAVLAAAAGALVLVSLVFACISCSRRFSDALAPHAADRSPGLWNWFKPAFFEDPAKPFSIDGRVLVNFCVLGRNFCSIGSVIACVLVPLYSWLDGDAPLQTGFLQHTAANLNVGVGWGSQRLWFVILAMYALVGVLCWLVKRDWQDFVRLRRDHFVELAECHAHRTAERFPEAAILKAGEAQAMHSVMIEQLPCGIRGSEDLRDAFERLFPDGVVACHTVGLPQVPAWCVCIKRCFKMRPLPPTTAFVTLDSVSKRTTVLQSVALFDVRDVANESYGDWRILPAPQKEDLVWGNVGLRLSNVQVRALLFHIGCVLGFVFWSAPLLFLMSVLTPTFLHEVLPDTFGNLKTNHPTIYGLVTSQVPMSVIWVVQWLVPVVFRWAALHVEGRKQRSMVEQLVLFRSFFFETATYYFLAVGSTAALSVWINFFSQTLGRPICLLAILATALPQVAVNYIVQVVSIAVIMLFMELQPLALFRALRGKAADGPLYCHFSSKALTLAMVLNFANMFSVICPLIMPVCAVFFMVAKWTFCWSLQCTYGRFVPGSRIRASEFDSHGGLWYELFKCTMMGIALGVAAMAGVILARLALALADTEDRWLLASCIAMLVSLAVLIFLIIYFWWHCSATYEKWSKVMTFEDAARVDRDPGRAALVAAFDPNYYTDPTAQRGAEGADSSGSPSDGSPNGDAGEGA